MYSKLLIFVSAVAFASASCPDSCSGKCKFFLRLQKGTRTHIIQIQDMDRADPTIRALVLHVGQV